MAGVAGRWLAAWGRQCCAVLPMVFTAAPGAGIHYSMPGVRGPYTNSMVYLYYV